MKSFLDYDNEISRKYLDKITEALSNKLYLNSNDYSYYLPWQYHRNRRLSEREEYFLENPVFSVLLISAATVVEYYVKQRKSEKQDFISPSDIAQFKFCPASYSIQKSFNIPQTNTMVRGEKLHNEVRLIKRFLLTPIITDVFKEEEYINDRNSVFFDAINKSKLIYSGHYKGQERDFKNKNGSLMGKPDYIFQDDKGLYFVVEEKFRFDKNDNSFYDNHLQQVGAYIYGISEPQISYGYLVYWGCSCNNESINIDECHIKQVNKDEQLRDELNDAFKEIEMMNRGYHISFDLSKINVNKCVNCSVAGICAHKKGIFKSITFPYHKGRYHFSDWRKVQRINNEALLMLLRGIVLCDCCKNWHYYNDTHFQFVTRNEDNKLKIVLDKDVDYLKIDEAPYHFYHGLNKLLLCKKCIDELPTFTVD